jgi:hypothetical protein
MNHHSGPTAQARADAFHRLHDDVMPIPEAFVPTARCYLTCPACPCSERRSLSAASGGGLPTRKGRASAENPRKNQVRKGRPKRALSSLISRVSGGRDRLSALRSTWPEATRCSWLRSPRPVDERATASPSMAPGWYRR